MVPAAGPSLVIACGALAREILALREANGWSGLDVRCLPAELHNHPERIPDAVRAEVRKARDITAPMPLAYSDCLADGDGPSLSLGPSPAGRGKTCASPLPAGEGSGERADARLGKARPAYRRIFVAYADCGTGGRLDAVLADEGVDRLPGAHCYETFAGSEEFAALAAAEPGTFYLTDFLARHFDRLVIEGLGIDRHPELAATYFAHYRRLVYLAQCASSPLEARAQAAARRLGLAYEYRRTGYGGLRTALLNFHAEPLACPS